MLYTLEYKLVWVAFVRSSADETTQTTTMKLSRWTTLDSTNVNSLHLSYLFILLLSYRIETCHRRHHLWTRSGRHHQRRLSFQREQHLMDNGHHAYDSYYMHPTAFFLIWHLKWYNDVSHHHTIPKILRLLPPRTERRQLPMSTTTMIFARWHGCCGWELPSVIPASSQSIRATTTTRKIRIQTRLVKNIANHVTKTNLLVTRFQVSRKHPLTTLARCSHTVPLFVVPSWIQHVSTRMW